jgi:creatinine amidohydrolase
VIAPAVPYGVTDYASGFCGAVSIPAATLTAFLEAVVAGYLNDGFAHVCLINNHLEPEHDQAVRAAATAHGVSVACPLTRRWARTLSDEFKRGNCHAGQYETSLILASHPETVRRGVADELPPLDTSLADGIQRGLTNFKQMGIERAYTGDPAAASAAEGEALLDKLAEMVVTEISEALGPARGTPA